LILSRAFLCPAVLLDIILAVWRAAGVAPGDVLKTMTSNGAELLRIAEERGAIAPGLSADIIAMPGDPLQDRP
jgi:imidazolonepropionase-like amidohydrolase